MTSFLTSLSLAARLGLGLGVALILGLTVTAALALNAPRFEPLFLDLREDDAAQISQQLEEWKIDFRIGEDGRSLSVPQGHANAVRLRLVSSGVPNGGRVGFELFKDSNFGVTEFAQRINFQRALQGELERTISAFAGVERARVHLNLPEGSSLLGRDQPKKASVALSLRPQAQLDAAQVRGIQDLVAAAVEGLDAASVVVLDEAGKPLQAAVIDDESSIATNEQATLEQVLAGRISHLLEALYPRQAFRIAIDAPLRDTDAPPAPAPAATDTRNPRLLPTATKAANGNGNGRLTTPARPTAAAFDPNSSRIERLSVAVMLPADLAADSVERLRPLIATAVGLRPERGDQLELAALIVPTAVEVERAAEQPIPSLRLPATAAAPAPSTSPLPWLAVSAAALIALLAGIALGRRRPRLDPRQRAAELARMQDWLRQDGATA